MILITCKTHQYDHQRKQGHLVQATKQKFVKLESAYLIGLRLFEKHWKGVYLIVYLSRRQINGINVLIDGLKTGRNNLVSV